MSQKTGQQYERLAVKFLKQHGMKILRQNYRSKMGEIDVIARDGNTLVFIEVKYRQSTQFGSSAEMVSYNKQIKIIKTAQLYLTQHPDAQNVPCRFDIIAIQHQPRLLIDWIQNAFTN